MPDNKKLMRQRKRVYQRENECCFYCNKWMRFEDSTRDHIIPKSRGGMNLYENVVLSCAPCNSERGDMPAEDFLMRKLA